MGNISIRDFSKNKENPFLKQAVEQVQNNIVKKYKTATKTGQQAVLQAVDKNGEILGHTQFIRQIEVDEEKFAKVYLSNFSSFFDLKTSGIRVFGYILNQLVPNKDEFMFFLDDCLEYTGYKSHKSVHQGLAQLLEMEVIARGRNENLYYINPLIVFNGNRISFTKTYVKKKKPKISDPNQVTIFDEIAEREQEKATQNTDNAIKKAKEITDNPKGI